MTTGRSMRMYLADGDAKGILTIEIGNWTGKVLVAPRSRLADLGIRAEAKWAGIYFLVGQDPEFESRDMVYVGESETIWNRLISHDKNDDKDFWTKTVIVVSKDENLTKAHIKYLEARFIQIIKDAGEARLANSTGPDVSLPEADQADMEFFIDQVRLVLPVLGLSFTHTRPRRSTVSGTSSANVAFEFAPSGAHATMQILDGEYVVLKGSTACAQRNQSWSSFVRVRDQLEQEGKLTASDDPELLIFTEDVAFKSPSSAASVIYGGNQNGRTSWKIKGTKKTLKEWQEEQLGDIQ
ncbi:MAG: GIY-YIG nuclease family protein [Planctomycetes bacterium]|nr:GIY-YIG nuclease family protein [Planctomycetota bacterium]